MSAKARRRGMSEGVVLYCENETLTSREQGSKIRGGWKKNRREPSQGQEQHKLMKTRKAGDANKREGS